MAATISSQMTGGALLQDCLEVTDKSSQGIRANIYGLSGDPCLSPQQIYGK